MTPLSHQILRLKKSLQVQTYGNIFWGTPPESIVFTILKFLRLSDRSLLFLCSAVCAKNMSKTASASDLAKSGVFKDCSYISVGDPYLDPHKGLQLYVFLTILISSCEFFLIGYGC